MFRIVLCLVYFAGAVLASPSSAVDDASGFERLEQRLDLIQKGNEEQLLMIKKLLKSIDSVAESSNQIYNKLSEKVPIESCTQVTFSGVYTLQNDNLPAPKEVYCEMKTLGGGWTVIQQRLDGSVNFNRSWADYRDGFGTVGKATEFWLGLEAVHQLTSQQIQQYEIIIELKNEHGKYGYARYGVFGIDDESTGYKLSSLYQYQREGSIEDSLSILKDEQFSTYDRDNDKRDDANCAEKHSGGWWFYQCKAVFLNGPFVKDKSTNKGIFWNEWTNAATYSRMMIRPKV